MLDIKFIRENKDLVKENALKRGIRVDVDKLLVLDERRRELIGEIEALRAQQNLVSSEISKEKYDNQRYEKIN
jgi:seryl-tRNA synthetase